MGYSGENERGWAVMVLTCRYMENCGCSQDGKGDRVEGKSGCREAKEKRVEVRKCGVIGEIVMDKF